MRVWLKHALHPVPELQRVDTSLRYTDILFGFVIKELFVRLQNWAQLDSVVQCHLIVGTTLVLGSWIGFRRSLNRSSYEVKFFSLPLFRFLIDQMMLILYFRIAVLTEVNATLVSNSLATDTMHLVMYVFVLYVTWDVLGIFMANAKTHDGKPRYPLESGGKMTAESQPADWVGFSISAFALLTFFALSLIADRIQPTCLLITITALLLVYRWAKEIRTSWKLSKRA